jgi:acetylornithine deacetylase
MNEIEREALRWIERHQGDLVAQLQRLVSVPSVVGAEGECQRVVAELLRGPCDSVDVWEPDALWLERHPAYSLRGTTFTGRPNVVGVVRGRGGGRSLILNAHVDVVDPGPPDAWQYAPWSGAIAEGSLYGRGAADDKASLAVIIFVAQCIRDLGISPAGDLILQSVIDEEWGGAGTLSTIHRGYRADAAIVFEPSGLDICPASRGGQAFRITVAGKGAHPIRSYEGVSALEKALPILAALKDLERVRQERLRTPLFERYPVFAPIVIGKISADRIPSKVPETCVFEGLMGYAPDETFGEARQDLEGCVARVASTDPWLREHPPAVEWLALNKEGAQIPVDHPLVALMSASFQDVMEGRPTIVGFPAGCDLPLLRKYGGMPGLVFGPGNCTIAHSSNEHVPIQEVVSAAKIVAITALRWCGKPRDPDGETLGSSS